MGRGVPLKDRPVSPSAHRAGEGRENRPRTRHCWVATAEGDREGLVLAWSTTGPRSWSAYVVYVTAGEDRAVQEWVPAERLRPGVGG